MVDQHAVGGADRGGKIAQAAIGEPMVFDVVEDVVEQTVA